MNEAAASHEQMDKCRRWVASLQPAHTPAAAAAINNVDVGQNHARLWAHEALDAMKAGELTSLAD